MAGPAQPLTELTPAGRADEQRVLIPLERDIRRFGLAQLDLSQGPKVNVPVKWRNFPNGIDPAPVAHVRSCGQSWVAYAAPQNALPSAPHELRFAALLSTGLGTTEIIARSRRILTISMAAIDGGVLLAYTDESRTWARRLSCKKV